MTVTDSWQTITEWLGTNLPTAAEQISPPAGDADIRAVEEALGLALPADLTEWLRLCNGFGPTNSFGGLLPPLHNPISCTEMLAARAQSLNIDQRLAGLHHLPEPQNVAGTKAMRFHPAFLPFADDHAGTKLFVDLRPGDLHGCIGQWDPEQIGFINGPVWAGTAAMLADVAQSLTTGNPVFGSYDDPPGPDRREPMEPELIDDDSWLHWI